MDKIKYELATLLVCDMNCADDDKDEMLQTGLKAVNDLVSIFNIRLIKVSFKGRKRLAYDIEHHQFAGYYDINYEVDEDKASLVASALSRLLETRDAVMRHLLIRKEDDEE